MIARPVFRPQQQGFQFSEEGFGGDHRIISDRPRSDAGAHDQPRDLSFTSTMRRYVDGFQELRACARWRAGRNPANKPKGLWKSPPTGGRSLPDRPPHSIQDVVRTRTPPPRARDTAGVERRSVRHDRIAASAGQLLHDPERGLPDLLPIVTITHAHSPHLKCPRACGGRAEPRCGAATT